LPPISGTGLRASAKPVVAAVIIDPEIQGIPFKIRESRTLGREGVERIRVSGVKNLTYLSYDQDIPAQIEIFQRVVSFSTLAILIIEGSEREFDNVLTVASAQLVELGVDVSFVSVGHAIDDALSRLPVGVEAVAVNAMPHLRPEEFDRLVAGLNQRRLPTFSLLGRQDVLRGVMASSRVSRDDLFVIRRVALNLFNILIGKEAAEIPVDFSLDEQLTINVATARKVGVDPTFALLTEAELIGEEETPPGKRFSLGAVVRAAAEVNLDLIEIGRAHV